VGKAGPVWVVSGMCPEHLSAMSPERSVRHVSGHHTPWARSRVGNPLANGAAEAPMDRTPDTNALVRMGGAGRTRTSDRRIMRASTSKNMPDKPTDQA